ncbi:MAG TPA: DUF6776 family protein [Steroidobacteraceae bacterium]|jgi:hypothetical protein|nr:DUF6776 family protein [Steroidobacteraceae bacterium]
MADLFGKLVVRPHAPRRRAVLLGVAVLLALSVLYGAFELGRYDAGFRVVDSVRGALSASARIRALEAENGRQREQLAAADVARRVDREGYKQVERSLGDMQSQIARLNQDLSFYRGLVQPDSLVHVKVQQMQIVPEAAAGQYRLKFVLMQTGKPDKVVAGTAAIAIEGLLRNKPTTLTFAQVSPSRRGGLSYSFRYFQDYDEPVQLSPGFEPTRIGIEIHSGRDAVHGFRQAFVWKAQGMSLETEAAAPGAAGLGERDVQTETE